MQEAVDDPMDLEMQLLETRHDTGSGARQILHTAILVVQSVQMFLEGISDHGSPSLSRVCSIDGSPDQQYHEKASHEDIEETAIEFVDGDQVVPLLKTADNTLLTGKKIRIATHVLRFIVTFKAHAASVASARAHHDNSSATEGMPEVAAASDTLAASPEHHITVDQPEKCSQIKSISKIVLQKNLQTLQAFGGLSGVKDALGSDLEKGISHEEALYRQQELSLNRAPSCTFVHLVWKEVKKKTILLFFLVVALSIAFEIDEQGLHYVWTYGVVVLIAIILQVLFPSIHKYWKEQRRRKKLQKQPEEARVREVHVIRGGETKDVSESELVYGDLLLLKKDCQVPANGLFVDGEDLQLDYGSESYIANKQKPFLSYGERVINGNARMVVTSTHMIRSKDTYDPTTRFTLELQLNKMNAYMNYIRIAISILIILVLFLRHITGKMDDDNVYKPESMAEPNGTRSFSNTFEKIIKESKYTKALIKLLCVSLIGLTDGVPFVFSLALFYWNEETLYSKTTEQDSHGILKMASVTKICTDAFTEFTEDDTEVQKLFIGGEFSEGRTLAPNVVEALCDGLERERMKQVQQTEESDEMTLHLNGSVNEIMSRCTHFYNIEGEKVSMNDKVRRDFVKANNKMECVDKLSTRALACKPTDTQTHDAEDWILVALLGLEHKDMKAQIAEVKALKECGIEITIVSNKKLPVLKDLALRYGLVTDSDLENSVFTAEDFRNCSDKERLEIVNNIRVLGEAFSSDKLLLVETLREKGEVVVFLGQTTDEVPALMGADIGIAMGRRSSEKVRESSDIIMWDWSFSEISTMVHSGRCIYHNTQSFLQPVLITTISITVINVIQTATLGDASLTTIQSVYVNLAVLFLGGLALLTKTSADKPVSLDPVSCGRPLISAHVTRNIFVQVSYQVTCLVIIQTKGSGIVGSSQNMKTVLSNIYIICQFFNLFNARELQKINFFRCIHGHKMFWVAITPFVVLHATIYVVVQDILGYGPRLNWKLWAGCVLVGLLSWLVDLIAKRISWFIKEFVNRFCNMLY